MSLLLENHWFSPKWPNPSFWPYELILRYSTKIKKTTPSFLMRNPKLVLVLILDSHSKNANVGSLCNPQPVQLYVGRKVECIKWGKLLAIGLLTGFQAKQHGIFHSFVLERMRRAHCHNLGVGTQKISLRLRRSVTAAPYRTALRGRKVRGCEFLECELALFYRNRGYRVTVAREYFRKGSALRHAGIDGRHARPRGFQELSPGNGFTLPARIGGWRQDCSAIPSLHMTSSWNTFNNSNASGALSLMTTMTPQLLYVSKLLLSRLFCTQFEVLKLFNRGIIKNLAMLTHYLTF